MAIEGIAWLRRPVARGIRLEHSRYSAIAWNVSKGDWDVVMLCIGHVEMEVWHHAAAHVSACGDALASLDAIAFPNSGAAALEVEIGCAGTVGMADLNVIIGRTPAVAVVRIDNSDYHA